MDSNDTNISKYFSPCRTFGLRRVQKRTSDRASPLINTEASSIHTPTSNRLPICQAKTDDATIETNPQTPLKTAWSSPLISESCPKMGLSKRIKKQGVKRRNLHPRDVLKCGISNELTPKEDSEENEFASPGVKKDFKDAALRKVTEPSEDTMEFTDDAITNEVQSGNRVEETTGSPKSVGAVDKCVPSEFNPSNPDLKQSGVSSGEEKSDIVIRESEETEKDDVSSGQTWISIHGTKSMRTYGRPKRNTPLRSNQLTKQRTLIRLQSFAKQQVCLEESISLVRPKPWEALLAQVSVMAPGYSLGQDIIDELLAADKEIEDINRETQRWYKGGQEVILGLLDAMHQRGARHMTVSLLLKEQGIDPEAVGYDEVNEEFISFTKFMNSKKSF